MKLGTLSKRALYKELVGSIGYHDARRVVRFVDEGINENDDLDKLSSLLKEKGFDERQTQLITETVKNLNLLG